MKKITFTFLQAIFTFYSYAQSGIEWQNTIGGSQYDILRSVQQTTDGGYILGGYSRSDASGDKTENNLGIEDYWVVKTDTFGNIQWQNTIGGNSIERLYSVQQTTDGGYILGGSSRSPISGDKTENSLGNDDYWIVKTDAFGNIQWQNTIGGSSDDLLRSVKQTTDGGYILGGYSSSPISGDKTESHIGVGDYWVVKTDTFGNIQWQNTIGGNSTDQLYSVQQTTDGGYILGGYSGSNASGDKTENSLGSYDYWVIKLDAFGNIQWQNTIGGSSGEFLSSVQQTTDGGYILGGYSLSPISGDKTENSHLSGYDYWVVKTDAFGNIQWQNTIGGSSSDELYSVQQTTDGGYILGGYSFSMGRLGTHNYNYWVVKLDISGNIQWQNTIGGNSDEQLYSIQQTSDNGYILGGYSSSSSSCDKSEDNLGSQDYWLVKLPENPQPPFADILMQPDSINRGTQLQIQFSADNLIFQQGTEGMVFENQSTRIYWDAMQYLSDTTAIGTYTIPLDAACGMYELYEGHCSYYFPDKLEVSCPPVDVVVQPDTATRCSQLQVNFSSVNFDFIQGSDVLYFENGAHQIRPDTFIILSDSTAVGFFTILNDDSCGTYSLKSYTTYTFPDKFTVSCDSGSCYVIGGSVFRDLNADCIRDSGELAFKNAVIEITNGPFTNYASSDSNGFYSFYRPAATYDLRVIPSYPQFLTPPCSNPVQNVTLSAINDSATINFPLFTLYHCPIMEVDISASSLRICRSGTYTVQYCNHGTTTADSAWVEVEMDSFITVNSSSIPWNLPQSGNTYVFNIGNVGIGQCGSFTINITVDCANTIVGQTHCVSAHIYPYSLCLPPDTTWDGSSVQVGGRCSNTNDTVLFFIQNVGVNAMQDSLTYSIVEDNVMLRTKKFKLPSGGVITPFELANGSTWRLEAQQSFGHPGRSKPSVTVEGCGTNGSGGVSQGFVIILPEDDYDPFISIDCQETIGPYDPNDKHAYPKGVGSEKFITSDDDLEYHIRFQNTGNDTAFLVVIRDTLSPYLDLGTVIPGTASHDYDFRIYGTGILEWTFQNILLPDSNVNEPESHGFVKFRVAQKPGNLPGIVIQNQAAIYFDFNAPVLTNTEYNTVGERGTDFLVWNGFPVIINEGFDRDNNILLYPNPFYDELTIEIENQPSESLKFEVYSLQGRKIFSYEISNANQFSIANMSLSKGMYLYRLTADGNLIGSGKIIGQ